MLVLARRIVEAIFVEMGGMRMRILIADLRLGGRSRTSGQARIAIDAPPEVCIWREELGPIYHRGVNHAGNSSTDAKADPTGEGSGPVPSI